MVRSQVVCSAKLLLFSYHSLCSSSNSSSNSNSAIMLFLLFRHNFHIYFMFCYLNQLLTSLLKLINQSKINCICITFSMSVTALRRLRCSCCCLCLWLAETKNYWCRLLDVWYLVLGGYRTYNIHSINSCLFWIWKSHAFESSGMDTFHIPPRIITYWPINAKWHKYQYTVQHIHYTRTLYM